MEAILKYLKTQGAVLDRAYYERIARWTEWYRGHVESFHKYRVFTGVKRIERTRYQLGMCKKAAEEWANLLLNERVLLTTENKKFQVQLADTLNANKFYSRGNQLIEKAFALGTGAFVEWLDADGAVVIDYVQADMIFPLTVENGEITECAFASERKGGYYIQVHRKGLVQNKMIDDKGKEIALPYGVAPEVKSPAKLFQIVKPNIVNNIDLRQPLGISVFANALDQAKGADIAFDGLVNDMLLGRTRAYIPMKYATVQQVADGSRKPVFDPNDALFYVFEGQADENKDNKIQVTQPLIRATEHITALEDCLSRFSDKCGLGADRFKYAQGTIQTATQVISEKSALYQNVQKHNLGLRDALADMVAAIAALLKVKAPGDISVTMDDSIIEDKAKRKADFIMEINAGIRQAWEYRVEFLGETENDARAATGEIAEDASAEDDAAGTGGNGDMKPGAGKKPGAGNSKA